MEIKFYGLNRVDFAQVRFGPRRVPVVGTQYGVFSFVTYGSVTWLRQAVGLDRELLVGDRDLHGLSTRVQHGRRAHSRAARVKNLEHRREKREAIEIGRRPGSTSAPKGKCGDRPVVPMDIEYERIPNTCKNLCIETITREA